MTCLPGVKQLPLYPVTQADLETEEQEMTTTSSASSPGLDPSLVLVLRFYTHIDL